jgi:hypothetical protein
MSPTFDTDMEEFENRITELEASPKDTDKRRRMCTQSMFMTDSVLTAINEYGDFINQGHRREQVLLLFDRAVNAISGIDDTYYNIVLGMANLAKRKLAKAFPEKSTVTA